VPWIVACVAIVLAMGGTGLAAKKYLITSTKQISPKVLATLRGAKGARGLPGPAGAAGANGANGAPGAPGAAGTARAYAEVLVTPSLHIVANVGFATNAVRSPSAGIYCIVAPAGVDPNSVLIVGLAGGSSNVGFATHAPRTVCNANEYQVATVDPTNVLTSLISFDILAP
jgi:hypothetical protein